MKVLILNAGSSTQKSCLYDLGGPSLPSHPPQPLWEANIDWLATPQEGLLKVKANGIKQEISLPLDNRPHGITKLLETLIEGETAVLDTLAAITAVGHRVVHGGTAYSQATLITPEVKETIRQLIPLAPTHNPAHLEGIEAIEAILGNIPQVAVFDTAFHTSIPPAAAIYPLPYEWTERGIRRYGFHGTSHQYCSNRAVELLGQPRESLKLVTCHLGNGCSLAAIAQGKSIDTTMGFTPLEGLMMATRSGSIDPAILLYLLREHQLTPEQLNTLLNKESGLKGVSCLSGDLRTVLAAREAGNQQADLAFSIYIHRLKSGIGSMVASLGGLDALIFTAGAGENSPLVREQVCQGLGFLGLELDAQKNNARPLDADIATPSSRVRILVVHTEEDWAIAQETWHLLQKGLK